MAFWQGFLVGLSMIIFIGPVFFTLLQAAFQFGFKSGWAVAWGIIVSDVVCVVLCKMGAAVLLENKQYVWYFGIAGVILLLGMGLNYLLNPNLTKKKAIEVTPSDYVGYFLKGFFVNFDYNFSIIFRECFIPKNCKWITCIFIQITIPCKKILK